MNYIMNFLMFQVAFLIFPIVQKPLAPGICFAFIASGIPVYLIFVRPEKAPKWALKLEHKISIILQKLCDALPEGSETEGSLSNGSTHTNGVKDGIDNPAFNKEK